MNSTPRTPQKTILQNIKYTGSESEFAAKVSGHDVTVHCNSGKHTHGSSKVKLINRIDYNWEFHYYRGNLVAVHIDGKIVAYGMKGKEGGMVRVTNQETGERALIKNLKNDVKDVSFSFSKQRIILGCIDDEGNVLIYEIMDEISAIKFKLLLHIYHSDVTPHSSPNYRIIWCPFLNNYEEEEESPDDPENMFVILNGKKAEVWNFNIINLKYGAGPIEANESLDGYVEIVDNDELVDASFSGDGTAIAVACADGFVKFFQIYMVDGEKQKCLHEWRPHDGKQLSSIIFVDNLLDTHGQCWKFTITGANHNSELKLWSCETWSCLQTIYFKPDPSNVIQNVYFKMCIDYTAQYLVMSDINNKVLYILQLSRNDAAQAIAVTMISQFLLPTAFLSFHITEASYRKIRSSDISEEYRNELDDPEDDDEDDEDDDARIPVCFIKLLVIQQKKFQECNVVFQPETMLCNTELIENSAKLENGTEKLPKLDDLQTSVTLLIQQQQQLTLMTPEALTTEQTSSPNSARNGDIKEGQANIENVENLIDFQRPEKDNFASGGSSPSREVQEILSLNNSTSYSTQDFYDNLSKMQDDEEEEEQEIPQKEYTEPIICQENASSDLVWLKMQLKEQQQNEKDESICLQPQSAEVNLNDAEWNKTHMQAMNFRLTSIENAIGKQNVVIQKIYQELKMVNQNTNVKEVTKETLCTEIDLAMSKQQVQIAKMLENLVNMQKNSMKDDRDHLIASFSQVVTKSVCDKLQSIVANETTLVIVPTIRNIFETLKRQLDVQNTQKFNNDKALQEKISKMLNAKALAENLSLAVANTITPILEKLYREMIASTLLPSWEKVSANMFQQINSTFTQGTKEYTQSVENYMDRQRRSQERSKDLVVQMQVVSESLLNASENLGPNLSSEIHKEMQTSLKIMQDSLIQNVKEVISEQVKLGFKSHASVLEDSVINAVRSRAVTPAPHGDSQVTRQHLDYLLSKENFDEAFQMALSAENLSFVIYVCEKVDPNTLFNEPCQLQQNCILALIQQLSMELLKHTELKLSYIRVALVALIPGCSYTKQFVPKVLKDVLKQLQIFMTSSTNQRLVNEAKLIKMVVESILEK